ncbi:MAG: amino acid adenylation domain-containing protein, partial [Leadbetterella sp.]|nr:amino acid adenylation domain-containing protein [Leadbetterella sp.]
RVKQNTLSAYSHQMYPFDRLVEELDLVRDTSRSAIFDAMLVLQNNGGNVADFELQEGQTDQILEYGSKTSKFDILISVEEQGDYLSFSLEYNSDVYEREQMSGLLIHYKRYLWGLLSDSMASLGRINYLSSEEHQQVIFDFNQTEVAYADKTVMELFEEQVVKTPHQVAIVFEDKKLSYEDLNRESNNLAHVLKEKYNASVSIKIGVMLERSLESVISMIGVMKTGACYVPIDHEYPVERVNYIMKDSNIALLISSEGLWQKHGIAESEVLDIKKVDTSAEKNNPLRTNALDDASYVIYTSGSTGHPKGVLQTHRMMSNLIQWDIHHSGMTTGLKHLQYASFSFDASLHDLYFMLSSSGSAYLVNESSRLDYLALREEILKNEIEVISMPFSALNAFCLEAEIDEVSNHHIKYIVSTAEQLYVNERLEKFLENNPRVQLHNHYGPSESHVVTSYTMSSSQGNVERRSSIGKPISNSSIYILDGYKNSVPIGVEGELYIGGANLALGYLNKEELTRERFVANPFKLGELLYKTGDQGYWRSDGNIEFIGRKDDQVKIRGYRIELGEIEYALLKSEQIEEAVVIAKNNSQGEKDLVAYITGTTEQNINDLRNYLKTILPDYMLPVYYIQLEKLPLTSNGKIDKKSLPDPKGLGLISGVEYVAPRNEIEEKLVKIWQEVLQREHIGVRDDFFAMGGHSLKATKVVAKINHEFKSGIKIGNLFSTSTIEDLSSIIDFAINQKNIKLETNDLKEIKL